MQKQPDMVGVIGAFELLRELLEEAEGRFNKRAAAVVHTVADHRPLSLSCTPNSHSPAAPRLLAAEDPSLPRRAFIPVEDHQLP